MNNLTLEAIIAKKSFKIRRYEDDVELWFPMSVSIHKKPYRFRANVLIVNRSRGIRRWNINGGSIRKFLQFHRNMDVEVLSIEKEQLLLELLD